TLLTDGHREQQEGLILSQEGTQRNLQSLPQKRLVWSAAPQVRFSLSRLVWSRFVECYERGMAGKKKILIVEDNSDIRKLMVFFLERMGYDVLEAATGLAAIERA